MTDIQSLHRFSQFFRGFEDGLGILEMRCGFHNCLRPLFRIAGLENSRSDENRFGAQVANERGAMQERYVRSLRGGINFVGFFDQDKAGRLREDLDVCLAALADPSESM